MRKATGALVLAALSYFSGAPATLAQDFRDVAIFVTYGDGVYDTGLTLRELAEVFRNNHPGNQATWVEQGPDRRLLRVINVDPLTEEKRKMVFLFFHGSGGAVVQRLAVGLREASEREIFVTMMEIAATLEARRRSDASPQ
ncbi:MAG: hypothetical protein GWN84_09910 [Gammaproteobacteria bacterium]|nr:hypothetical protein [Gammaproteobacteria bacterium]NIR83178.1 hypothetical protein [Gammaproteobacteria bacterium]NIR90986.1 hypothetical protein [Gammaproteobacteria bacterium]NIU04343.1 hypothetical protein [Gammaproteobacteria bacterium]NIV52566.1 hypothetical protein [Gammaproteobacteria bacterium]